MARIADGAAWLAALTFPAMEFSSNDHIPPEGW
jgi:hypothetical protein